MFYSLLYKLKYTRRKIRTFISQILYEIKREKKIIKKILIILCIPYRFIKVLLGKELIIPYVELVLTTVCNLRCSGCSALIYRYKKPEHIDQDINIKSLKNLLEACDSLTYLRLLGGEPLCYPKLKEIIKFLKTQSNIRKIAIVTNGTMTIQDEELIELLKDDRFHFSISRYDNFSDKYDKLIKQLDENKIKYIPMREEYEWIDYGDFTKRNRTNKQVNKQFLKCNHKVRSLLKGKLFQCFRCSHATNLNLINLKESDYIDLLDDKTSIKERKKKLNKFIYGYYPYVESCFYCDCMNNPKIIPRGKQLN